MKKNGTKKNRRKPGTKKKKNKQQRTHKPGPENHGKRAKKGKSWFSFPDVAAWKVIVGALIIGALGVLYLNHVFATEKMLGEVQQMQRKYNQVKRSHDNYRLIYERMIGPAEIYNKAKAHGFINGGPAEKVIKVEKE